MGVDKAVDYASTDKTKYVRVFLAKFGMGRLRLLIKLTVIHLSFTTKSGPACHHFFVKHSHQNSASDFSAVAEIPPLSPHKSLALAYLSKVFKNYQYLMS